jgi:hypothetical protein
MAENRVAAQAKNGQSINEVVAQKAAAPKVKATQEMVLAAHLNQTREQVIQMRGQIAQQEQIISQLQVENAKLEIAMLQSENQKLRDQYGLTEGLKFEKDAEGQWWLASSEAQEANPTA